MRSGRWLRWGGAPVVPLTGPRRAGKSSLARNVVGPDPAHLSGQEDPRDDARLGEPALSLSRLGGTVVLDEAQRRRGLFPVLRVLADEDPRPGRFLVLGSASPELTGLASDSLAGRVTTLDLGGFLLADAGGDALDRLWRRGGLPRSFLAGDEDWSQSWREDYISTLPGAGSREPWGAFTRDDDVPVLVDAGSIFTARSGTGRNWPGRWA